MRRAFTLVEMLVVIAIIAVLAAIILPALASARRSAHLTACQSRLYQIGQAIQIHQSDRGYPRDLSDLVESGILKEEMIRCPYPQTDSPEYVYILPEVRGTARQVPAGRTIAYCVEHMERGMESTFEVPLAGEVVYLRYPTAAGRAQAASLERFEKVGRKWEKVEEDGSLPSFPETWRFPKDPWPPQED